MTIIDRNSILFSPIQIGQLKLANRIVVPPMVQLRGLCTDEGIEWYRRLAESSAGLVICEATSVFALGNDLDLNSVTRLVDVIHKAGAKAAIQLFPIRFGEKALVVDELAEADIQHFISGFGSAARFCAEAGFDAVEVHGAHGYLINRFFMPDLNHRTDGYGGLLANRCRLAVEIVEAMKKNAGKDMVLLYRHSPVGRKYTVSDSLYLAKTLADAGLDGLDISPGMDGDCVAALSEPFKQNDQINLPVITVGGMEDLSAAEKAINEGRCDMVAIGRQMITDAGFINKILEGRESEISWCTKCNVNCYGALKRKEPVKCARQA